MRNPVGQDGLLMDFSYGRATRGFGIAHFEARNLQPAIFERDIAPKDERFKQIVNTPRMCPNFDRIIQLAGLIGLTEDQINLDEKFCGVWATAEDSIGPLSGRRGTSYTPETFCERIYRATCQAIRDATEAAVKPPLVESYQKKHFILDLTSEQAVEEAIKEIQCESSDIRYRMHGANYLTSWRARLNGVNPSGEVTNAFPFQASPGVSIGQRKSHDFANMVTSDLNKAAINMVKTEARAFCKQILGRKPIELSPNFGKRGGITVAKLNEIGKGIIQNALSNKPKKIQACPQMPQENFFGMIKLMHRGLLPCAEAPLLLKNFFIML